MGIKSEKLLAFLNKYFVFISIFLITISYLPYINVISWGDDYAGYILQSKAMFSGSSNEFIEKQKFLHSLSLVPKFPIYTPIGMPLLIGITSFLTNFDVYFVKLIIPISVLLLSFILNEKRYNSLVLLLLVHPTITDQYRDILGELPAVLFLLLGISTKNNFLKILLFACSCMIKPTFLIFVFFELFFSSFNKFKNLSFLMIFFALLQISSNILFSMRFFGLYFSNNLQTSNLSIIEVFIYNFEKLTYSRFLFFLEEIGLMLLGFSNPANSIVGVLFILFLFSLNNKYSYMCLVFMFFHFLFWDADYFVRYLLPVLFLSIIATRKNSLINFQPKKNINLLVLSIFFSLFVFQNLLTISKIDNQTGPHQASSIELFNFVNQLEENYIFNFHSPRTFRLFTGQDAYKLDGKIYTDTKLICYADLECKLSEKFESIFKNQYYELYFKKK